MNVDDYIAALAREGCGEHLEYDPEFLELINQVTAREESQYGDYVHVPEPIDWISIEARCISLFKRTHDLRVAVCLARAWLEREGLVGFANGLQLVAFLLQARWEGVYPRLSADDQFDPLVRINALAELAVPSTVVARLRREVLARTVDGDSLCCSDLALIASTNESCERDECLVRLTGLIEPICSADLMRGLGVLKRIKRLLVDIGQCLDEHTGLAAVSPLQTLVQLLQQWIQVVDSRLRNTLSANVIERIEERPVHHVGVAQYAGSKAFSSREEVVIALEAIEAYYSLHEPSSPIPMLVRRVRRLAGKDFLEIIAELAPSSIDDMRALAGAQED
ncbi:hypothetical protein GCM10009504_05500 [Pseudomonas laurentiana]|uniref:Type VI secretion system protein TssA n=1 Tax=Pseudomonas laurentiana TaxID=2364649 RepID=A0A6I5RLZ5_9PSED|nr:type VI secretion system protein TssA [Pseudomonas laurentiana]NES09134.1 type VI secretion system protein TssA [Pseudomonas laurentiana]GGU51698.1 hypothetical protein GCM10009504_05500 [Pseudomonas laurentiana]